MPYDDIIHLSRPFSTKHPPMPMEKRAAQFSPFAALTGYEAMACEAARRTTAKSLLCDDALDRLTITTQQLLRLDPHPLVCVEYFVPDACKDGGAYHTYSGIIKKIDTAFHRLVFMDNTQLPLESVRSIHSPLMPDDIFYD